MNQCFNNGEKNMSELMISTLKEKDIKSLFLPAEKSKVDLEMSYLLRLKEKEPRLTVSDFQSFIVKAQTFGADPLKEHIYLIPFNMQVYDPVTRKKESKRMASVVFSYHFQLARAEEHPQYDGHTLTEGIGDYFDVVKSEVIKQPYYDCEVYRKDRTRPVNFRAWFPEFKKTKQDWDTKKEVLNAQWSSQPMNMLRKCALMNALKQAFPQELNGMNTEFDEKNNVKVEDNAENTFDASYTQNVPRGTIAKEEAKQEESIKEAEPEQKTFEDIVISFGPLQGKKISEADPKQLRNFYTMVKGAADKKIAAGDPITDAIKNLLTSCEEFFITEE